MRRRSRGRRLFSLGRGGAGGAPRDQAASCDPPRWRRSSVGSGAAGNGIMTAPRHRTVVQGEASETDSEEEVYLTSVPGGSLPPVYGVKIPGEASETDEEDAGPLGPKAKPKLISTELPPLVVFRNEELGSPTAVEEKPALRIQHHGRYSTLLQQKLVESNTRLYYDVNSTIKQVYQTAIREIGAITGQLSNSQNGIISASHNIRLVLEDLRAVADKIDIITSCNLLPDIQIEPPPLNT